MASRSFEFSVEDGKIDAQNNEIRQVSLISLGQARGHKAETGEQMWVDGKTLDQIFDCLTEMGTLKLKLDHGGGVKTIAGWVDGFEKTGSKVLGEMHFYESEPEKEKLFEIAKKNPDHLGLSLEFDGDDEILGNKCFARCDEVFAVAAVDQAAANTSLFQKSTKFVDSASGNDKKKSMAKKILDDAPEAAADPIAEMSKKFTDFCKKYDDDMKDRDEKMKKFDDYLNNNDGRAAIDGPGRNIDPNVDPVVTDDDKSAESDKNMDADPGKKDDDDDKAAGTKKEMDDQGEKGDVDKKIEFQVEKRMKAFAASLGTKLPTSGVGPGITNGKGPARTWEAVVDEKTKEFSGDKNKALLHCLALVRKADPEMIKLYGASRSKFLKVEPKANRYL